MSSLGRWLRADPYRSFWAAAFPLGLHALATLLFPQAISGFVSLLVLLWLAMVVFAYYRGGDL